MNNTQFVSQFCSTHVSWAPCVSWAFTWWSLHTCFLAPRSSPRTKVFIVGKVHVHTYTPALHSDEMTVLIYHSYPYLRRDKHSGSWQSDKANAFITRPTANSHSASTSYGAVQVKYILIREEKMKTEMLVRQWWVLGRKTKDWWECLFQEARSQKPLGQGHKRKASEKGLQ
jgi:hypothetical protein